MSWRRPPPAAEPSAVVVTPAEVLRTPGALDNVFRTLQTLPGVAAAEEFGSRMAVRGGAPDQNLTVMDGVEIHDPYRLFGLTSAFNPETISRFELATGGFSVKYGDRLSSLLVVENRAGVPTRGSTDRPHSAYRRQHRPRGRAAEGAAGSWLVTARRTYYDLVAEGGRPGVPPVRGHAGARASGNWRRTDAVGVRACAAGRMRRSTSRTMTRAVNSTTTPNDLASVRLDAAFGPRADRTRPWPMSVLRHRSG